MRIKVLHPTLIKQVIHSAPTFKCSDTPPIMTTVRVPSLYQYSPSEAAVIGASLYLYYPSDHIATSVKRWWRGALVR